MTTVSIADQLKVLIELQGLDAQIYQFQRELRSKPEQVTRAKAEHQAAVQGTHFSETQYKALEVKRNQMEIELNQKETQLQKLQGQLFQVKTNKEYSAMQKEIEGLKADKSVLEEEILKLMEEVDRAKGRMGSDREALKAKETSLSAEMARIDQEAKKIQSSVDELRAARNLLIPKVDPQILSRYERILENKAGLALVPVKGSACGGCNMVLPPQLINEAQLAPRLVTCESCARILYVEPTG